ncbi:B-cell linker protein [Denticeps clupeoides]|uniref:B-cell linker protein n=1 Tax=Denticeps clupeoides TaxID=299321 RepID=UPI0010A3582C|nr:B-cell linker protein-like [Denticeps clupeoides]
MTMSFFKVKSRHNAPPAPPKRSDNTTYGWPDNEFDEEDSDTYEAPPCEIPIRPMTSKPVEENVYLDRSSSPAVNNRQAMPPPPASQEHTELLPHVDPTCKPPEVDRKEKPGKKASKQPPAIPPPPANQEEDVYLDPNEDQDERDELYLEPTAASLPTNRGPMPLPPSPKAMMPLPTLMKPPIPRSSTLPVMEGRTVVPAESRRSSFPTKLPPPTPMMKPPLPCTVKEPKPGLPLPVSVDGGSVPPCGPKMTGQKGSEEVGLEGREWFAGKCDRRAAEELLLRISKDGAFLVRRSSSSDARQPYTLVVLYRQKVYNIPVRYIEATKSYALGKEGKKNEELFSSLQEIISHHEDNPILLIDSKTQAKHTAHLTQAARP